MPYLITFSITLLLTIQIHATTTTEDIEIIIPKILADNIYENIQIEGETIIDQTAIQSIKSEIETPQKELYTPSQTISYQTDNNIEGSYIIESGAENFRKIDRSILVIEKLNNDDYGYYYFTKMGSTVPTSFCGIFHHENGKFKQKLIDEKGETSFVSNDLKLLSDGNRLEMTHKINCGTRSILWVKTSDNIVASTPELQKSLESAKEDYIQIYKNKMLALHM
jgi:hypothetical protein